MDFYRYFDHYQIGWCGAASRNRPVVTIIVISYYVITFFVLSYALVREWIYIVSASFYLGIL